MTLRIQKLTKVYRRRNGQAFKAVNALDFELPQGDRLYIFGESGSGKSSLLSMVAGLMKPESGRIFLGETELCYNNSADFIRWRAGAIGYIPQGRSLLPSLTVMENLLLPVSFAGGDVDEAENRAICLLQRLGVEHLANEWPSDISGGQQRRVGIARSLINNPDLLLADEPLGDLDDRSALLVNELFCDLSAKGVTVIMVAHDTRPGILDTWPTRLEMSQGVLKETKIKEVIR